MRAIVWMCKCMYTYTLALFVACFSIRVVICYIVGSQNIVGCTIGQKPQYQNQLIYISFFPILHKIPLNISQHTVRTSGHVSWWNCVSFLKFMCTFWKCVNCILYKEEKSTHTYKQYVEALPESRNDFILQFVHISNET